LASTAIIGEHYPPELSAVDALEGNVWIPYKRAWFSTAWSNINYRILAGDFN
jgi:hypothetical protein